jgi:hypothetical protein
VRILRLSEFQDMYFAKKEACIFISAKTKENIEDFKTESV